MWRAQQQGEKEQPSTTSVTSGVETPCQKEGRREEDDGEAGIAALTAGRRLRHGRLMKLSVGKAHGFGFLMRGFIF